MHSGNGFIELFPVSISALVNLKVFMKKNFFAKLAVLSAASMTLVGNVYAQAASTGISAALDSVDLSGIATKVSAAGLLIIAIALVFKGPALAKRIISKV